MAAAPAFAWSAGSGPSRLPMTLRQAPCRAASATDKFAGTAAARSATRPQPGAAPVLFLRRTVPILLPRRGPGWGKTAAPGRAAGYESEGPMEKLLLWALGVLLPLTGGADFPPWSMPATTFEGRPEQAAAVTALLRSLPEAGILDCWGGGESAFHRALRRVKATGAEGLAAQALARELSGGRLRP